MDNRLYDSGLTEEAAYLRYSKFKGWTFPVVPRGDWHYFYRDLAYLEECFVVGSAIGSVPDLPFTFQVSDSTPIRCRYPRQPPERHEWLAAYMEEQC